LNPSRYKYFLRAVYLMITALFLCAAAVPVEPCFLLLVNGENPLPASYVPRGLTVYNRVYIHAAARDAFVLLREAMEADGVYGLHLHSAYRDYDRQQYLFAQKTRHYKSQGYPREEAEALAANTVQRPGASEHQTGLALDVSTTGKLDQAFGQTQAGQWLSANAHRFGFIIRYPRSKTRITHITYEPWHLRYAGIPHAAVMYENDWTLEEYVKHLAVFSPPCGRCGGATTRDASV
jgi:D-alanyl-D-alanine carboxypeptidase